MKHIVITLLSAFTALFLVACGGGTVCDDAADIQRSAIEDACANQMSCAFCTCIDDPNAEGCTVTEDPDATCAGEAETAAQACVDGESACSMAAAATVELACGLGG